MLDAMASKPRVFVEGIGLSNADRVLWPALGLTKLDLARYWEAVAEHALPHLVERPLTLVRCPDGLAPGGDAKSGGCFYMRHSKVWSPPGLKTVRIREKTKTGEYLVIESLRSVIALAQMSVLEIRVWNTRIDRVEQPDRVIFDLDPGPDVGWKQVVAAAKLVRDALRAIRLESFVKTTGGRGLHVVVPIERRLEVPEVLAFSRAVSEAIERHDPKRFTTDFAKAGREKKILVDYLRNNRTNTAIAAFSPRARPGATVSTPIAWEELGRTEPPAFTMVTVPKRLARLRKDPWARWWKLRQRIDAGAASDGEPRVEL